VRFALVVALALLACNDRPLRNADIRATQIEQLADRDRGELISLTGTVSNVEARGTHEGLHCSFRLSHGGHEVVVVTQGVLPDRFRERVARARGRALGRHAQRSR
jgi:cytochrome c-type biogenesis protein CcmE